MRTRITFALLVVAALTRCANQIAPQGGPKDSLPPVVKSIISTPGGVRNVKPARIFIETDEYVQLRDLGKEFYTSPLMSTKPTVTVRGRGVRIDIRDTLADNQTYSLNFGNSIRDNNEGNPLAGFRYVFSTGPALDSLLVTGYVADAAKGDSVSRAYVFFFDSALDTVPEYDSILFKHRPLAVGRTENNGIFVAQNLRDVRYRAYAMLDNNNNFRYDPGTDKVGFLDSVFSPAALGATAVWRDEYRRYTTADPQLYFRMFAENAPRRQNLNASERPARHQVILRFAAPHPRIDTLAFDGIPQERIIREYMTPGRDTMALWFDIAPDAMPDTLKGRIDYLKPDSVGNMAPFSQRLRLAWRKVETREQERERERIAKERERALARGEEYTEPPEANPFRFKVDVTGKVNPEKGIPIEFEMPLSSLDSTRIELVAVPDLGDESAMPFRVVQDTVNIRRWVITADWNERHSYRLTVPAGVFTNVAGERNDSLGSKFSIAERADFASLAVTVEGKTPQARYIVQVVDGKGATLRHLAGVASGVYRFDYLPEGEASIRITEDGNGNGVWDSGSLVERRQPERTEFWVGPTGDRLIAMAPGSQIDITLDMARIFAPTSIDKIRDDLRRAEDARVTKYLEEKAKRDADKRKGSQAGGSSGLGIGSALGGAKDQIQSTVR